MPRFPKPPAIKLPKPPSVPAGASSFLWAVGLGLYIFLGGMSIGIAAETILIAAVVAGCAIFLFVRLYGEDDPNRP